MNKRIIGEDVAILYSPGFGAGWSTWNTEWKEELIFDPVIVDMIRDNRRNEIAEYCERTYPGIFLGGLEDLTIQWVPQGQLFYIREYDGSERVILQETQEFLVA